MLKRVTIMQPYLFPYVAYYKLMNCADVHVILDDVNFKKRSFITRNEILHNQSSVSRKFNLNINCSSQNRKINQHTVHSDNVALIHFFSYSLQNVDMILRNECIDIIKLACNQNLADTLHSTIKIMNKYLNIATPIIRSSDLKLTSDLRSENKIIEICKVLGATHYMNLPGGKCLYSRQKFKDHKIELEFLDLKVIERKFPNNICMFQSILGLLDQGFDQNYITDLIRCEL